MNLNRVPDRTIEEMRLLTEEAVRRIGTPIFLEGIRAFLIQPRIEMRTWEWNNPPIEYPVWIVAESQQHDYGIAFTDYGFGPEHPWGLVFLSERVFNADYCWYSTIEAAYRDSRLREEREESQHKG